MPGEERRQRIGIARVQIRCEGITRKGIAVGINSAAHGSLISRRSLVSAVIVDAVDNLSGIVDCLLSCRISRHGAVEHSTVLIHADNRLTGRGIAVKQRIVKQTVLEVDHGRTSAVVLTHCIAVDDHIAQYETVNMVLDIDDGIRDRLCLVATHLHAIDEGAEAITRLHRHGGDGRHARAVRRLCS